MRRPVTHKRKAAARERPIQRIVSPQTRHFSGCIVLPVCSSGKEEEESQRALSLDRNARVCKCTLPRVTTSRMHNDDKHSNDDTEVAALRKPSTEDTPQSLIDFMTSTVPSLSKCMNDKKPRSGVTSPFTTSSSSASRGRPQLTS